MNSAETAERLKAGDAVLIDVREPNEWAGTGVDAALVQVVARARGHA